MMLLLLSMMMMSMMMKEEQRGAGLRQIGQALLCLRQGDDDGHDNDATSAVNDDDEGGVEGLGIGVTVVVGLHSLKYTELYLGKL